MRRRGKPPYGGIVEMLTRMLLVIVLGLTVIRHASALTPNETSGDPSSARAASVITLCGLAVMVVVEKRAGTTSLLAGEAMQHTLTDLGINSASPGVYELTDIYAPLAESCAKILTEHDKAADRPGA